MKGKNILVVGGSSGIGLSVVEQLAKLGANVIAISRTKVPEFDTWGVAYYPIDVTAKFELNFLPKELHGLVYCPGTINLKPFHRLSEDEFRHDFEINIMGAIKVLQLSFRQLKRVRGASVVMFSTVASSIGMGFHSSVAMVKSGVEGLAKSLAAEWANSKVRVNVIAPSLTDTPLAANLLSTPEKQESSNKRHPIGRYGKPADIANAVVFLLSENSDWVTGQVLNVDGGLSSVKMV